MNQVYDISKVTILIQDSNFDLFKWDGQEVTQYELPEGYERMSENSTYGVVTGKPKYSNLS